MFLTADRFKICKDVSTPICCSFFMAFIKEHVGDECFVLPSVSLKKYCKLPRNLKYKKTFVASMRF
jgi:hypothetical protein